MASLDRVRIVVLGDSGVGKTSLVHLLAHEAPLRQLKYTVGAHVEVKLHQFREGTPAQKTYWIELVDVGGFHSHRNSRHLFYHNAHGVILVHDLSNNKSQHNLDKWIREFMDRESGSAKQREADWESTERLEPVDVNIPLLVIGTKQDLVSGGGGLLVHQRRSFLAEEYLTEEIHLNCQDEKSLMPGSSALNKLARFFDKVVEKQFYNGNGGLRGSRSDLRGAGYDYQRKRM